MHCPNCTSDTFNGLTCFQCGYGPPIQPDDEPPSGLPLKVVNDLTNMQQVVEEPWKEPCPKCGLRMFDGWDCANLLCRHSIPEKARKMHGRILSPAEADEWRKQNGIP